MRSIALITIALVGLATPALAQDRTPPVSDLRVYSAPIDWSANQLQAPVGSDYRASFAGRSVAPATAAHNVRKHKSL